MTTWMVVEDEPELYDMVLSMYELMGFEGVAFTEGDQALAWIEGVEAGHIQSELPELALLDIRLPTEISGADVGERLRQSPLLGNIAIVLMTAYRLTPHEEKALVKQAGADLLIYKPLPHIDKFYEMLRKTLDTRRA